MKRVALVMLVLLTATCPAITKSYHGHRHAARTLHHASRTSDHHASRTSTGESHSGITCDMVRAYVAQVGLAQAVAMAQSAGITSSEKERARHCLAEKS